MSRNSLRDHPSKRRARGAVLVSLVLAAGMLPALFATASTSDRPTPQGHYVFRNYGAAEGLNYTAVLHLLQDRHGFIWTGTDDGLYRYDAYRFDRFGVEQGLPSAVVDALHEDRRGVLWVGTRAGLSRWNETGFVAVPHAVATGTVIHAISDNADGLWLASSDGLHVAGRELEFRLTPGWSGGEATALWQGRLATGLWVARWDGQAHVLRREGDTWKSYSLPDEPPHERIGALAEDREGRIWARSGTRLWALDAARQAFERVATPLPLTGSRGYLAVGQRGDLWVSTNDEVLHRDGERWTEAFGGAVLGARPVLEDHEGSLWFGVGGLRRMAGRGIFHAYHAVEGLPGNVVWSIARDRDQTLWVGTERGLARAVGDRFETIPGTEAHLIRSIVPAADGTLYLAGVPTHEILSYDPARGELRHHPHGLAISPGRIYRLLLDREGTLWAATDNAGLLKADSRDPQLRFAGEALPGGTPEESVSGLHEDATGRVWAAGQRGLAVRENNRWRRLTTADGLRHNEISYVRSTRNGDLLVVYNGVRGFLRARYEHGALRILRHVDSASTRSADQIFLIGEDANDNVWVGTGRGIKLYTADRTEHFSAVHGLIGEDTTNMAFLAEPNGDVWIGVVGGLMRFDAAAYRALPPRPAPAAGLLDVRVGDQPFAPAAKDVQVRHTANSFQVRYAGPSFIGDEIVQYKLRLDGLEMTENITDSREARYSALPHGSYRFEVAARVGPLGAWGTPATFAFQVLPAWWQTWWARVLFGLAIALGAIQVMRWRLVALKRRNRLLEDHVATRTRELQAERRGLEGANAQLKGAMDELRRTQSELIESEKMASLGRLVAGVAHEMNTPLGVGMTAITFVRGQIADMKSALDRHESSEHEQIEALIAPLDSAATMAENNLARAANMVKNFKQVAVDQSNSTIRTVVLRDYLVGILQALHPALKKTGLEALVECDPRIEVTSRPDAIYQVISNLVMNSVVHGYSEGRIGSIRIGADLDGALVRLRYADDGVGMEAAVAQHIFEPFFTTKRELGGTGLGLHIVYNLVTQALGGRISCTTAPGKGVHFDVVFPLVHPGAAHEPG